MALYRTLAGRPRSAGMKTLFHSAMYDDSRPVPSYWEATAGPPPQGLVPLEGSQSCDVAVIGAGYTGLSAALHLARDYGVDVRVLEAGHIGWGASGRNGGFCCLSATKLSIQSMIKRYGLEETKRFYAAQLEGIELVDTLGAAESIAFDRQGDGTFTVAHKPARLSELTEEAEALTSLFGVAARVMSAEEFRAVGHDSTEQHGALHTAAGFALHPLKFLRGLAEAALRHGAQLHPGSRVVDWQRGDGKHRLVTSGGSLTAKRVIVATNGFSRDGLHEALAGRFLPALSSIIVTRPLTTEELAAQSWQTETPISNTRDLLFYYRLLPDRRLLFGSRGDSRGDPDAAARRRAWMVRRFGEVFPHWADVSISYSWRGLVCLTARLTPTVGRLDDDPSVWYGFGYHGNGVNSAPWTGMMLARLMAGSNSREIDLPAPIAGLAPRIPFAALRLWYLRSAYLYYRIHDALT